MPYAVPNRDCGDGRRRADAGSFSPYAAKTTAYTVLTTDAGTTFSNVGASGSVTFTLPTAAEGLFYRFLNPVAQNIVLTATGGAKINGGSANGSVTIPSGAVGITTIASNGTDWFLTNAAAGRFPINFAGVSPGTETTGSVMTTGAAWLSHTAVGSCALKLLCSYIAATGDYATLRIRARSDYASGSQSGTTNGVVAGNFSASANLADYANLFAVQAFAQPLTQNQSDAAHICCAIYAAIDRTTGTSSGRHWVAWIDDHSKTKAAAGHYLMRLSYNPNGGSGNGGDGIFTVYGPQFAQLFNFEYDQAGAPFVRGATIASGACLGTIRVKTSDGTQGYINVLAQS